MKKSTLVLLTFVPVLVGYLIDKAIFIPVIGSTIFYVIPYLVLAFWFYLGKEYSKTDWKFIQSVFISSATGVLSLVLYLWQFLGYDESRNRVLAVLSQMYSLSIPSYLFGKLAILFEPEINSVGLATQTTMQVFSLVLMIVIFSSGYFFGKKQQKNTKVQ